MITLVSIWERGWFDPEVEAFMWKQLTKAYSVDRVIFTPTELERRTYPEQYDTMSEALDSTTGEQIFLIPNAGESLIDFEHPEDAVYIFGNAYKSNLDIAKRIVHIPTPKSVDVFARDAAAMVLYDRMIKNGN